MQAKITRGTWLKFVRDWASARKHFNLLKLKLKAIELLGLYTLFNI